MDTITLGRTDLKVSVMGLGCGGPSRVGQRSGKTKADSIAVVRQALDAGITLIDTAEGYQTEEIVGEAIRGFDRDSLVLSTKKSTWQPITPQDVRQSLEDSLRRLGTDHIDIYHLHGVVLQDYEYLTTEIVPTLQRLRERGKIGFIGITERFNADPQHRMLQRALQDDVWDVIMVGFNMLNQSARQRVFPQAIKRNLGTLIMFAVRLAFSRPQRLAEILEQMVESGQVDSADLDADDPLGFLVREGGALSRPDAAYRFCRYEPGVHVVLSGTGDPAHLRANIASLSRPPLPHEDVLRLRRMFGRVDSVSGQ